MKRAMAMAMVGISLAVLSLMSPAVAQAQDGSAAPAACSWRTAEQKTLGGTGWVKLFVNGCSKAYMQAWWPPGKSFECSIYSEAGRRYLEFTVKGYGCLSDQVNVGSDKVFAFAWVTDYRSGAYLGSAGTGFHRAN